MLADTNNLIELIATSLIGSTSGDWMILAIIFMATLGMGLIYARAKASTAVAVIAAVALMFSFVVDGLMFIWWLAIIASIFILINGLRKWITSQA